MRQGLDIGCYLGGFLLQFSNTVLDFKQFEGALLEFCQVESQQFNTLTNVVMKLSCDPGALLLLLPNQPAGPTQEGLLRQLALGDVRYHAYNPQHFALFVEVKRLLLSSQTTLPSGRTTR